MTTRGQSPIRTSAPSAAAAIVKRSISIAGHRTSVSLEDAFWRELKRLAVARGRSVSSLVATIDEDRQDANLSSAIRVFVLDALVKRQ
jgi:predicted DNA-binding ribbon-helix-helix protein